MHGRGARAGCKGCTGGYGRARASDLVLAALLPRGPPPSTAVRVLGQRVGGAQPERVAQHRGHAARAHAARGGMVVRVGVEVAAQQHAVGQRGGAPLERAEQLADLHGAQLLDLLREIEISYTRCRSPARDIDLLREIQICCARFDVGRVEQASYTRMCTCTCMYTCTCVCMRCGACRCVCVAASTAGARGVGLGLGLGLGLGIGLGLGLGFG